MTKTIDDPSIVIRQEPHGGVLADSIPICVWVAGPEGNIYYGNRAWQEYAGPEAGSDFRAAVPASELEPLGRIWRDVVQGERPVDWEQRLRRRDGALCWHLCRMVPMRDNAGQVFRWIVTATDIEAQKQSEAAKDQFLAVISHELRTPIGAILGWTRMLRSGTVGQDNVGRALETIERTATAQAKLLEDIFDVCRIVSGKLRIDVRRMDLHQLIENAVDLVQPIAVAKGVVLEKSLEGDVKDFAGDPDRLQQVVWNLLTNAIKFTPRTGRVVVRVRRESNEVVIDVRDTGAGISRDFLPHVFGTFRQADESSANRESGLGLGLSIVRHIVELHGGIVSAFSDGEDTGSTFTVRLPLHAIGGTSGEEAGGAQGRP
jgi:PAS domain S-box-containing protein